MAHREEVPTVREIQGLEEYVDLDTLFASPLFRIRYWRCLRDGQVLREERTNEWDALTLVDHGAFVHHMGGESALVDPTSVVLNEAWRPYRTSHLFGCGDHGFHVLMRSDVLGEALGEEGCRRPGNNRPGNNRPGNRRRGILMARIGGRSRAALRQRLLVRRLRRGLPVDPLAVEESVLDLLHEVLDDLARRGAAPRASLGDETRQTHGELVESVRGLLWERLSEPLRIDDVARALHVSPFHLCRIFKRTAGETIHQYRNRLRLVEALEPVGEPDTDLASLAFDLGFSSHSHFTSAFRRLFAMTPTEFRRLTSARREETMKTLWPGGRPSDSLG